MDPFDLLGGVMGQSLSLAAATAFDAAMLAIWQSGLALLEGAFVLVDKFSVFTVDIHSGPIGLLWPLTLWVSGILALGLFFWQLIVTNLRGGRGFLRLVIGPVQYGVALAATVGLVAAFLAAADGLTAGILSYGMNATNFTDAIRHTSLTDASSDVARAAVLGIGALVGVIPAAIGYTLEMLYREAAIYVLVATIPILAAGLLAQVTSTWFWTSARWLVVVIIMKPGLAFVLVIGVAVEGGAQGLSGILAGIGVLLISLFAPFVLFRLFAFIDPNTPAGAAFRDAASSAGVDSYGKNNPAMKAARALGGDGTDATEQAEQANTARFDDAATTATGDDGQATPQDDAAAGEEPDGDPAGDSPPEGAGDDDTADTGGDGETAPDPTPPGSASDPEGDTGGRDDPGNDPTPPGPPGGGDPPDPDDNGGGGKGADSTTSGAAEDAAVVA